MKNKIQKALNDSRFNPIEAIERLIEIELQNQWIKLTAIWMFVVVLISISFFLYFN